MHISNICTLHGVDNSGETLKKSILSAEYKKFDDYFIGVTQDPKARICFLEKSEINTLNGRKATQEAIELFKERGLFGADEKDAHILLKNFRERCSPPLPPPVPPRSTQSSKISAINGFKNLGNTCYANASLKFLICSIGVENLYNHLLSLRNEYALSREQIQLLDGLSVHKRLVFIEKGVKEEELKQYVLYKFMDVVVSSAEQNKGPLEKQLQDFLGALQLLPDFRNFSVIGQQQDPNEFLLKLGDVFQFDKMPAYTTSLNSILIDGARKRNGSSHANVYLQTANIVDRTATLQDMVNAIYAPEQVKLKWLASDLENIWVTKKHELLVDDIEQFKRFNLHIAAFAYTDRGVQKIIFERANFAGQVFLPVIDKKTGQEWLLTLEPQEIIVHRGESANSGHYYIYSKNGDIWQKHDDSVVTNNRIASGEQAKMISFAVVEKSRA